MVRQIYVFGGIFIYNWQLFADYMSTVLGSIDLDLLIATLNPT